MKVRCINRINFVTLTKGKIYEVINSSIINNSYKIYNDIGDSCHYPQEIFEVVNEEEYKMKYFNTDELKSGMVVELRCGLRYLVVHETLINGNGFMRIKSYINCNSTFKSDDSFDIMKVFDTQKPHLTTIDKLDRAENLIWERIEQKEMTVEEIEKALGYSVKIVK